MYQIKKKKMPVNMSEYMNVSTVYNTVYICLYVAGEVLLGAEELLWSTIHIYEYVLCMPINLFTYLLNVSIYLSMYISIYSFIYISIFIYAGSVEV